MVGERREDGEPARRAGREAEQPIAGRARRRSRAPRRDVRVARSMELAGIPATVRARWIVMMPSSSRVTSSRPERRSSPVRELAGEAVADHPAAAAGRAAPTGSPRRARTVARQYARSVEQHVRAVSDDLRPDAAWATSTARPVERPRTRRRASELQGRLHPGELHACRPWKHRRRARHEHPATLPGERTDDGGVTRSARGDAGGRDRLAVLERDLHLELVVAGVVPVLQTRPRRCATVACSTGVELRCPLSGTNCR